MRCFAAILLPDEIKEYADACRKGLAGYKLPVKWVARENYHLTVKFLGDLDDAKLTDVKRVLARCARETGKFELHAEGLGCFPHWQKPRVLWLGMGGQTGLALGLIDGVDRALAKRGFKKEKHQLHLTLGRVRQGQEGASGALLAERQGDIAPSSRSASFLIDSLCLMESRLGPGGPTYCLVEKYTLQ